MARAKVGTKPGSGKRYLAGERSRMVREQDRKLLQALKVKLRDARERQRLALRRATALCRRARATLKEKIRAYRAAERERIRREVREMRTRARNECQARKHRIRASSSSSIEARRAELEETRRLQAQLDRLTRAADRKARSWVTSKERRQESDDQVRGNLPAELVPVWEQVKRTIKAGPRTTRTEAFLEWAESHPEDVLYHQANETEREIRKLIAEGERMTRRMKQPRKTRALAQADDLADAVPF